MKYLFYSITLFLLLTLPDLLFAQPDMPSNPDQAPIDGGLGILAALGGSYAIKKLRDRQNE